MSLQQWFMKHGSAERDARDEAKNSFYLRSHEDREAERDKHHSLEFIAKQTGSRRPCDPVPRADAVQTKTQNDGGKRSSK